MSHLARLLLQAAAVLTLGTGVSLALAGQAAASTPTCFGQKATIVGSAKSTTIHGTKHNDVIYAGNGDDTVYGGDGNDLICGGYGADRLFGDGGNDWLSGGYGKKVTVGGKTYVEGDTLIGGPGNDFYSPGYDHRYPTRIPDRISFYTSRHAITVDVPTHTATGQGTDHWIGDNAEIYGSAHDDVFNGGPGTDLFMGGGGHDHLNGNGGDDVLRDDWPGKPDGEYDWLNGGDGNDQIYSQGGSDHIDGGAGNDTIYTLGHKGTYIQGGSGDDLIYQDLEKSSKQSVDGGPGTDDVHLFVDMSKNSWPRLIVHEESGQAWWNGQSSRFHFADAEKVDVHGFPLSFHGGSASYTVRSDGMWAFRAWGGPGNDIFYGAMSSDSYDGGPGNDQVSTGGGDDTCVSIETITGTCKQG